MKKGMKVGMVTNVEIKKTHQSWINLN